MIHFILHVLHRRISTIAAGCLDRKSEDSDSGYW